MDSLTTIARPYAQAVYELAVASNTVADWDALLDFLATVVLDPDTARLMDNPTVTREQLLELIKSVAADRLTVAGENLIKLLAGKRRLAILPAIALQFKALRATADKRVDVTFTSAVPLADSETQQFIKTLQHRLQRDVTFHAVVDAELIGGAVIRAGDVVIDGSVRGQLNRLLETL